MYYIKTVHIYTHKHGEWEGEESKTSLTREVELQVVFNFFVTVSLRCCELNLGP